MSGASLHLADTPPAPPTTSNDYEFAAIKDKHCVGAAAAVGRECVGVGVSVCVPDIYRVRCTGCWILLTLPAHSLVRSALEAHFNGFYGKAKNINQMGKYYWRNMRLPRCDFYCHPRLIPSTSHPLWISVCLVAMLFLLHSLLFPFRIAHKIAHEI